MEEETKALEKSLRDATKASVFNGSVHYKDECWMCHRFIQKGHGKIVYDEGISRFSVVCSEHETELPVMRHV